MQLPGKIPPKHFHGNYSVADCNDEMYFGSASGDTASAAASGLDRSERAPCGFHVKIPSQLQSQFIHFENIRRGMLLTMLDYTPEKNLTINFKIESSPLNFGANLAGAYEVQYGKQAVIKSYNAQQHEVVGTIYDSVGKMQIKAGTRIRVVGVTVDEALVPELLYGHEDYESLIRKLRMKNSGLNLFGNWGISPEIITIAAQVQNCRLQGVNGRIYLEGKALEIIALQLDRLRSEKRASMPMGKSDIRRLHDARDILFNSLEAPPSLMTLAATVGINDFKLKRGFREVFGDTPYGLLRKHRMEKARSLLLEGDLAVGEIAFTVGYTNISHFIAAFRKQYGVTPGQILQQNRRSYLPHQE